MRRRSRKETVCQFERRCRKSYPKSFKMQRVFDIVAHNAALMDARGHDIIVFYMQNEPSHSKNTTRKAPINCL